MILFGAETILNLLKDVKVSGFKIKGHQNIVLFSENVIVLFFLMEYLIRFICSPRKWRFFKQPMNLVDFFAIIPFMLDLVIGGLQVGKENRI